MPVFNLERENKHYTANILVVEDIRIGYLSHQLGIFYDLVLYFNLAWFMGTEQYLTKTQNLPCKNLFLSFLCFIDFSSFVNNFLFITSMDLLRTAIGIFE